MDKPPNLPGPLSQFTMSPSVSSKYVTFINPQPSKGMAVFARIADVLNERRPDIPLWLVAGRSGRSRSNSPKRQTSEDPGHAPGTSTRRDAGSSARV
jgi:hypothetical protein